MCRALWKNCVLKMNIENKIIVMRYEPLFSTRQSFSFISLSEFKKEGWGEGDQFAMQLCWNMHQFQEKYISLRKKEKQWNKQTNKQYLKVRTILVTTDVEKHLLKGWRPWVYEAWRINFDEPMSALARLSPPAHAAAVWWTSLTEHTTYTLCIYRMLQCLSH